MHIGIIDNMFKNSNGCAKLFYRKKRNIPFTFAENFRYDGRPKTNLLISLFLFSVVFNLKFGEYFTP